jgi:hypothetical protein
LKIVSLQSGLFAKQSASETGGHNSERKRIAVFKNAHLLHFAPLMAAFVSEPLLTRDGFKTLPAPLESAAYGTQFEVLK